MLNHSLLRVSKKQIIFYIFLFAFLLSSCAKKDKSSASDNTNKDLTTEIELFYYKQENQEGFEKLIKAFEASNKNIKVRLLIIPNDGDAAMSARAMQGKLPALMQLQAGVKVSEYAKKGYILDLSKTRAASRLIPSSLSSVSYNGNIFALPMDYSGIGLLCNKSVFDKLGITPPKNFMELTDICDICQQNNITPFAGLLKENWSAGHFLTMVHTALLSQNTNIDDAGKLSQFLDSFIDRMSAGRNLYERDIDLERFFQILDFYKVNMNTNAAEMLGGDQQRSFAYGQSAMMVQGLWSYVDAKKLNPALEAWFVPFPIFDENDKNKFYADVDSCFVVTTQVDKAQQEASVAFLDWLSSEGASLWVKDYNLTHSFSGGDFSTLDEPYIDLMKGVDKDGAYPWLFTKYPSIVFEDACKNGAQQYLLGFLSKDALFDGINSQWKEAVNK